MKSLIKLVQHEDMVAWAKTIDWLADPRRLAMIWYPKYQPLTPVALYAFTKDL